MLYITDNLDIRLTRGDTAALTVSIFDDINSKDYVIQSTDKLKLSVKKNIKDSEYCFQKIVTGTANITIEPIDTKSLDFGKYKYDIELEKDTGAISTIIEPRTFEIMPEVS